MQYRNFGQISMLDHYIRERSKGDPGFFETIVFSYDTEMPRIEEGRDNQLAPLETRIG